MGLRDLGILNLGAGGDNIRNVTASPLSGIDPEELVETLPLARQMHHHILSHRELYGLPRKFNIAFDGGGRISALEDTNDIGFRAVRIADTGSSPTESSVGFQLALGGITGHRDFATVSSIVVPPEQCVALATAIIRVFLAHGNRTDRKKARLKYLLDDWGHTRFLEEVERTYGRSLPRFAESCLTRHGSEDRGAHIGVHQQKQANLFYVGIVLPVGRLTTNQMRGLAAIADQYGTSELRLTVWQNLLVPNISAEDLDDVCHRIEQLGLDWKASNVRAGLVACTGNAGCKYAAANTKAHAIQLADYLDERLELDQPLNLHFTGCHHSCAQHYIGDLGFQATQVEDGDELVEGYHIVIGGGWGDRQAIARELVPSIKFEEIPPLVVRLLQAYNALRTSPEESFSQFANRLSIEKLRDMLAVPAIASAERRTNTNLSIA
jgi:ferredoxin-nitrite reductase